MDKLNKLRMLAGVAVKHTPTPKKSLMESAQKGSMAPKKKLAPKSKKNMERRVKCTNEAAVHLTRAIEALKQVPAVDYLNDVDQHIADLSAVLEGCAGKSGIVSLVETYQAEYRTLAAVKEGFEIDPPAEDDEHIQDPSEFAELSADADAAAYGEMGGEEDVTSPEVVAKIAAYAKEAGFDAAGEDMGADMAASEMDPAEMDLVGDERQLDDLGDEEMGDDEFADDEFDGPADPLTGEDPGAAGMEDPGYGEDDGEFAEFDEAAPAIVDKNESPNQLDHLEPSPTDDHDKKVTVPAALKTALRDQAAQARKEAKELGVADRDAKWFYENLAKMFEELLGHLEGGTVLDIKKAQIFMTSLMGPMLHKIPAEVVSFVAKGGADRTLKDYMKPVDKKYPVTGKMYKGE